VEYSTSETTYQLVWSQTWDPKNTSIKFVVTRVSCDIKSTGDDVSDVKIVFNFDGTPKDTFTWGRNTMDWTYVVSSGSIDPGNWGETLSVDFYLKGNNGYAGYVRHPEVWAKEMQDGSRALVLFNRSKADAQMSISWNEIGYPNHLYAEVRDLWQKKDLGKFKGNFSAMVPSHEVIMIRIKP